MSWQIILIGLFILIGLYSIFDRLKGCGVNSEIDLPYKSKQYLFSSSEHEFLRILNNSIDREKYLIFPKVRLADFIEVSTRGREYRGWWNKIKSKHIDFLIWNVQENKIALAIELDGRSHGSKKMQERDDFVNKLYEKVGIKLQRVRVGSDFISEIDNINKLLNV